MTTATLPIVATKPANSERPIRSVFAQPTLSPRTGARYHAASHLERGRRRGVGLEGAIV